MKLFMVIDYDRWGHSENLVRCEDADAAKALVAPSSKSIDVIEIDADKLGVLWCRDESPDSPRGTDYWGDR